MSQADAAKPELDQARLAATRFLVIGAGGLGCPALLGLVAGGARKLSIVDDDRVELSNLQRQVLYGVGDLGAAKVEAARWALAGRALEAAPLELSTLRARVDPGDADALDALLAELAGDPESAPAVVLECSDSPALKFAVHDACLRRGLPVVVAGVVAWRGQVMAVDPRRPEAACYRCLFEAPPPRELAPACATVGIMGAAAGVLGHAMAGCALDLAAGDGQAGGALVNFDLLAGRVRRIAPAPRPGCPACATRNTPAPRNNPRPSA